MIDYDKLKLAHELADKVRPTDGCITIDCAYQLGSDGELKPLYSIFTEDRDGMTDNLDFYNIDDVITKLRELTKPEPKYQMGQKLFMRLVQDIREVTVQEIPNDWRRSYKVEYFWDESQLWDDDCRINENELYPTKSALIEAQIEYWRDQLGEELEQHVSDYCKPTFEGEIKGFAVTPDILKSLLREECQHESDGLCYPSNPPQYKCAKCGEFYR